MSKPKFLLYSLIGGAGLALGLKWLAGRLSQANEAPRRAAGGTAYEKIDAYVGEQMARLSIPGAALAIVEGEQRFHLRGFGRARPGGERPTARTPFFIGSLTKSFTALAVMQLVEAGKIELDAPVQSYLGWFRVADPQISAEMTVRHLLNQTSGLPALAGEIVLADFDDSPQATERQVRALAGLKISRPVGSQCEYSNLNYNVLGLVIEAASGEAYPAYIQKHIFEPLGMRHSYTSLKDAKENGLAMGHRHWFGLPIPATHLKIPRGSLPSGQLISCAEDMARYLSAHLNGGRLGEVRILSEAGIAELHRGAAEYVVMGISAGRYGMGWFDIDMGQTKTYSHGGNVPDFSAFMALLPEQKRAVVLLLNADPYGLPPITEELGMGLTALLAGQQPGARRLDFIPWVMRLLPLIPILQIVDVLKTMRLLSEWRREPALRPGRGRLWAEQILSPLIPEATLMALLFYLQSSGLIRFLGLFMPDVAWVARISGGFAGIWAGLRSGLLLQAWSSTGERADG